MVNWQQFQMEWYAQYAPWHLRIYSEKDCVFWILSQNQNVRGVKCWRGKCKNLKQAKKKVVKVWKKISQKQFN